MKTGVMLVAGARPNFVKAAAIYRALRARGIPVRLCHTGQHYDWNMAGAFLRELGLPRPDCRLLCGAGSHAEQTARVLTGVEREILRRRPRLVLVLGDVNSTLGAALAAAKLGVPVAHVEAGLRSFDRSMPEEINRVAADAISDWFFVTEPAGLGNLRREGADPSRVFLVGNVMIDSLRRLLPRAAAIKLARRLGLPRGGYALVTLHRPANVDDRRTLTGLVGALGKIAAELPVVLAAHPRTLRRLREFRLAGRFRALRAGRAKKPPGLWLLPPQGYLEFLSLLADARMLLTDSGGLQAESSTLGVSCLLLRDRTEQPITVTRGTVRLVGCRPETVVAAARRALRRPRRARRIPLWDGRAGARIAAIVARILARGER